MGQPGPGRFRPMSSRCNASQGRTGSRTPGKEKPGLKIRPARVGNVPAIYELIRTFADRKLMIRRSLGELYESIREFLVAIDDNNRVVGCAALHVFWEDLAELKCLAVSERAHGQGVGRNLVDSCWEAARELELTSVFTLTYVPEFFEKCGYHRIDKHDLPHKIWNECVRCPLFPECHEVALIRSITEQPNPALVTLAEATV